MNEALFYNGILASRKPDGTYYIRGANGIEPVPGATWNPATGMLSNPGAGQVQIVNPALALQETQQRNMLMLAGGLILAYFFFFRRG